MKSVSNETIILKLSFERYASNPARSLFVLKREKVKIEKFVIFSPKVTIIIANN